MGGRGKTYCRTSGRPTFAHSLRAEPFRVREALAAMSCCLGPRIADDLLGRAELVLAEIMNNITEHGPWRAAMPFIHVRVDLTRHGLTIALTDNGTALPDDCINPRCLPDTTPMAEGGFGWYLVQDLTASLAYRRAGRRNFLSFEIPAEAA